MNEISIYQTDSGAIEVRLEQNTVWLTQAQMVSLFRRDQSVVSRHIGNVFKEGELERKSNMQKMHITNADKPVERYSLDVIISVGYRVKSRQGTRFRQWATRLLREHQEPPVPRWQQANRCISVRGLSQPQCPPAGWQRQPGDQRHRPCSACPIGGGVRPDAKRDDDSPDHAYAGARKQTLNEAAPLAGGVFPWTEPRKNGTGEVGPMLRSY